MAAAVVNNGKFSEVDSLLATGDFAGAKPLLEEIAALAALQAAGGDGDGDEQVGAEALLKLSMIDLSTGQYQSGLEKMDKVPDSLIADHPASCLSGVNAAAC